MREQDLIRRPQMPETVVDQVAPTVRRLLETQDAEFSNPMKGKELIKWVKSL
jgi:hypothetical protein